MHLSRENVYLHEMTVLRGKIHSLNDYKSQLFGLNMWDINKIINKDFYNDEHSTKKVKICSALLHAHNQDIEYS